MLQADVAVLEEPEHLNWYHHGQHWTDKFDHVVGIIHTNYLDYARREEQGDIKEKCLKALNSWVCRIHCHKVTFSCAACLHHLQILNAAQHVWRVLAVNLAHHVGILRHQQPHTVILC